LINPLELPQFIRKFHPVANFIDIQSNVQSTWNVYKLQLGLREDSPWN